MKYGIIGAMDEEIAYLRKHLSNQVEEEIANSLFIEGEIEGVSVVLLKSGIGKVNAAMSTTILMERFQPDLVINTGSAGGFAQHLSVGDIVISNEVVHHDVDATAFDYVYGQVPQMPASFLSNETLIERTQSIMEDLDLNYEIGLLGTGDSFMSDESRVEQVKKLFPNMIAAEMEGAAIAQVCYQYKIPFIIIRALSDIAGKESSLSFDEFLETAAQNATKIILSYIQHYK